jgi:hypothetical protein
MALAHKQRRTMTDDRIISTANQLFGSLCPKASAYTSARWEHHLGGSTPKAPPFLCITRLFDGNLFATKLDCRGFVGFLATSF